MNKAQREMLTKEIVEQISETQKDIVQTELLVKPIAPDCSLGRLTRMDALAMKAINEEALKMAKIRLTNLQKALPMLELEEYGVCQKCSKNIPIERLRVAPAAPICMACIAHMR